MNSSLKKTILVAPLNWGLGHAARCIPIINALLEHDYNVLLGSDGNALRLLEQEFPELSSITLPTYKITYPEDGRHFRKKMLFTLPNISIAIRKEKAMVKNLVKSGKIHGIISDNRPGVRHKDLTSIYVTHQLNVMSGSTTLLSSKMHHKYIKKFDACWVPDFKEDPNLSGKLGHTEKLENLVNYIGPLSRMKSKKVKKKYDILALVTGPEPQRTLLENLLLKKLRNSGGKVLIVQGIVEAKQKWTENGDNRLVNFLTTLDLQKAMNESELIISRSGYTSIMDLSALNKNAFLIPTPGQFEQEYLAERLQSQKSIPSCSQEDFTMEKLAMVDEFSGWPILKDSNQNFEALFSIF